MGARALPLLLEIEWEEEEGIVDASSRGTRLSILDIALYGERRRGSCFGFEGAGAEAGLVFAADLGVARIGCELVRVAVEDCEAWLLTKLPCGVRPPTKEPDFREGVLNLDAEEGDERSTMSSSM